MAHVNQWSPMINNQMEVECDIKLAEYWAVKIRLNEKKPAIDKDKEGM